MNIRTRLLLATVFLGLAATPVSGPMWEPTPITSCRSGMNAAPEFVGAGGRILYLSSCDPLADNSDRSTEIFAWEDGKTTQLTRGIYCQVFDFAASPDGQSIAFLSNCPHRGKNPDQGIELMVMGRGGEVTVLTRSRGQEVREPVWSADGRYLYFSSTGNFAGKNDDASQEIFSVDLRSTPPEFRQVTNTTAPRGCAYPVPVPGAVLAWCDEDFPQTAAPDAVRGLPTVVAGRKPGGNPDYNRELMSFSLEGEVSQITRTVDCVNQPAVADDRGRVIALVSDCNLTDPKKPGNGRQLYLYSGGKFNAVLPGLRLDPSDMAIARDGNALVFCASLATEKMNRGRNLEVFILRFNELNLPGNPSRGAFPPGLHLVTDFPTGSTRSPSFHPDGRTVVFAANANLERSNPDGSFEIMIARQTVTPKVPVKTDGDDRDSELDESDGPEEMEGPADAGDGDPEPEDEPTAEPEPAGGDFLEPEPADEPILPPELMLP